MTLNESPQDAQERLEQEAMVWQIRLTSGEAGADDWAGFEDWRRQSPAHEQAHRHVGGLWRQLEAPLRVERTRRLRAKQARTRTGRYAGLAAAACLLLGCVASFYPDYLFNSWADYHTRIGERTAVRLADGSVVHLNTDTALNVELNGDERRVRLWHGEAEFEVAHDGRRPFRVQSGDTVTEALGTRFVVRYERPSGLITLLQGRVRAARLTLDGAAVLAPGESVAFDRHTLSAPQAADVSSSDAWRRGRLIMNFVPLKRVVAELNRYRRGRIELLDSALGEREINAAIDLGNIDAWLDALPATWPVTLRRTGPLVMIASRND
jgi:transmembrane sensor